VGADLLHARAEGVDERKRGLEQVLLVPVPVGGEPLAVVVRPQVLQEREELRSEERLLGRRHHVETPP
jgi:hypothetical protein